MRGRIALFLATSLVALGLASSALAVNSGGGGGGAAFPKCGPGTSLPIGSLIVVIGIKGVWRCVAPNTFNPA